MNCRKLLRKFKGRLWREAIVKSFIAGFDFTLAIAIFFIAALKISDHDIHIKLMLAGGMASVFFFSFIFLIVLYRPTEKYVTRRIDTAGLKERTVTMMELRHDDSFIAEKQRKDTAEKLLHTSPSSIPAVFSKRIVKGCLLLIVMLVLVCVIPLRPGASALTEEEIQQQEQQKITDELIKQLRLIVDNSNADTAVKDQLYEVIDNLEDSFTENDTTLGRAAKISTASRKLKTIEKSLVLKNTYADYLAKESMTSEIASSVKSGDMVTLQLTLDTLSADISAKPCQQLSTIFSESVTKMEQFSDDGLLAAFTKCSEDLVKEDVVASEVFTTLVKDISDIVVNESTTEVTIDQMLALMHSTQNEITGKEDETTTEVPTTLAPEETTSSSDGQTGESQSGDSQNGEKQSGENQSGENQSGQSQNSQDQNSQNQNSQNQNSQNQNSQGSQNQSQNGQSSSSSQGSQGSQGKAGIGTDGEDGIGKDKSEKVYDSQNGIGSSLGQSSMPYSEVFDKYYSEALKDLTKSNISDDLRDVIEHYFSSLQ